MIKDNFIIKIVEKSPGKEWDELIQSSEDGSFFALNDFLEMQGEKSCYIIAYNNDGKIIGGIAGRIRGDKPIIGKFIKMFWVETGPIVNCNDDNLKVKIKIALLEKLKEAAKKEGVIQINITHWSRERNPDVFTKAEFQVTPFATYLLDLEQDEKKIYSNFRKGNKSTIKKAQKFNITIIHNNKNNFVSFLDSYYTVYQKTEERAIKIHSNTSMTLKPKIFLENILSNDNILSNIFLAVYEDQIASGALILRCGSKIIYYLGASDIYLNRKTGASNLLHWEIIKWAKSKGIKVYDLGGIPVNPTEDDPAYGVYIFKKGFGGEYKEYYGGTYIISHFRYQLMKKIMSNKKYLRFVRKII